MSEKVTIKVERKTLHLPTIALRGLVVFPNNLVHFEVGREKSIAAVEWAMANNSNVFLVAQKSMDTTDPAQADLFTYGVVAEVKQVLRVSEDLVKVLVEGKYRAKLTELDASGDFLLSEVRPAPVRPGKPEEAVETEALLRALKTGFDEYLGMNPRLGKDVVFAIVSSDDPAFLSEYMPAKLKRRSRKRLTSPWTRTSAIITCTNSCTSSAMNWARATTPTLRPTNTAAGSRNCTLRRTARRSCSRR